MPFLTRVSTKRQKAAITGNSDSTLATWGTETFRASLHVRVRSKLDDHHLGKSCRSSLGSSFMVDQWIVKEMKCIKRFL